MRILPYKKVPKLQSEKNIFKKKVALICFRKFTIPPLILPPIMGTDTFVVEITLSKGFASFVNCSLFLELTQFKMVCLSCQLKFTVRVTTVQKGLPFLSVGTNS